MHFINPSNTRAPAMETTTAVENGPYMPYEDTRLAMIPPSSIQASKDLLRICWPLQGSFPSALSVLKTRRSALEEMEPLVNEDGTWHEILSQSLFEPKISSIDLTVSVLDHYETEWGAWHTELEHPSAEFMAYEDLDKETQEKITGAPNSDDGKYLMRCCGQDRPMGKRNQSIRVTPSNGKEFVTLYDYMSAVHPWLMSLRDDIIQAMIVMEFGPTTPEDAPFEQWMVDADMVPDLDVETRRSWLQAHTPMKPINPALKEKMRAIKREEKEHQEAWCKAQK